MAQKLFEYAVIYHPRATKEQRDAGEEVHSEVVVPTGTVLAKDQNVATLLVARQIPEKFADRLDLLEILVRPF